jgi:hypothetical protein
MFLVLQFQWASAAADFQLRVFFAFWFHILSISYLTLPFSINDFAVALR